jgi:GT2 family glycosyltransferase
VSLPLVSVIIATHNKRELLKLCLESVLRTTYPYFEVITIDNASSDGTVKMIKAWSRSEPRLRLVENSTNLGPSIAYNIGIERAKGTCIATLDDDAIVGPQWLSSMVTMFNLNEGKIGAVQGNIVPVRDPSQVHEFSGPTCHLSVDRLGVGTKNVPTQTGQDVFYLNTCGCIFRRDVFEKAGRFDPNYFVYMFELDFGWRIRLAGFQTVFCALPPVYHIRMEYSMKRMPQTSIFEYRKNHTITLLKNYELSNVIRFTPMYLLLVLLQGAYYLSLRRDPVYLGSSFKAIYWILKNSRRLYRERMRIQTLIRRVDDKTILQLLSKPRIPLELLAD